MAALLGSVGDAGAFEARAGQRKRERTILVCAVLAAAVVLIPTAVGSTCAASGRCGDKAGASAGAPDEENGGVIASPPSKTRTSANATTATSNAPATVNASLSLNTSPPTQSATYSNSTSSSSLTIPPTAPETSLEDWQEMQALTASIQPRVTVVEGRPVHRGIASLSNPGTLVIVSYCVWKECAVKQGGRAQLIRTKAAYIVPFL
jgi:hypothetical protein